MASSEERPKNREVEDEMVRAPHTDGKPPRPATEPKTSSEDERKQQR